MSLKRGLWSYVREHSDSFWLQLATDDNERAAFRDGVYLLLDGAEVDRWTTAAGAAFPEDWELCGQLRAGTRGLPPGTGIGGLSID